jgi:hypothetical protein
MNRDEALTELARRHPESADLLDLLRAMRQPGRLAAKPIDFDAREQAAMKIVRAVIAKTGVASRNELLRACRHVADAAALSAAMFNLELMGEIRSETSVGPNGGRPQTLYQIV